MIRLQSIFDARDVLGLASHTRGISRRAPTVAAVNALIIVQGGATYATTVQQAVPRQLQAAAQYTIDNPRKCAPRSAGGLHAAYCTLQHISQPPDVRSPNWSSALGLGVGRGPRVEPAAALDTCTG
jgi:hypothetical protein